MAISLDPHDFAAPDSAGQRVQSEEIRDQTLPLVVSNSPAKRVSGLPSNVHAARLSQRVSAIEPKSRNRRRGAKSQLELFPLLVGLAFTRGRLQSSRCRKRGGSRRMASSGGGPSSPPLDGPQRDQPRQDAASDAAGHGLRRSDDPVGLLSHAERGSGRRGERFVDLIVVLENDHVGGRRQQQAVDLSSSPSIGV